MGDWTLDGETHPYRKKITIDNTYVDGDLTDKDFCIKLAELGSEFWTNTAGAGGIRVSLSDEVTRIPVEVVDYVDAGSTGTGVAWCKPGTIPSASAGWVYIYYGNGALSQPAADSTYGSENVYNSDYKLVAHANGSYDGTASEVLDSTSNDLHGTGGTGDSGETPDQVTAFLTNAQDYVSANSDHISFSTNAALEGSSAFTISCLFNPDSVSQYSRLFSRSNSDGSDISYLLLFTNAKRLNFYTGGGILASTNDLVIDTDYYVSATWNGLTSANSKQIHVNGVVDATAGKSGTGSTNALDFTVGTGAASAQLNPFDGTQAEIRYSDCARSDEWEKFCYWNLLQWTTLCTVGAQEAGPDTMSAMFGSANF